MKLTRSVSQIVKIHGLFGVVSLLAVSGTLNAQARLPEQTLRQPEQTYKALTTAHPDWVQVPGKLMRQDCVHEIPNGARVVIGSNGEPTGDVMLKGQFFAHYESCSEAPLSTRHVAAEQPKTLTHAPVPSFNGWVEDSQENLGLSASDNIDWESGEWYVPNNPSVNGGTIFLFNDIAPTAENWILQPVLQFGTSAAGGGNYWAIASWFVGTGGAWHSPLETVKAGDKLYGYTEQTGSGSTLHYNSEAYDLTSGAYSWISIYSTGLHWTYAYEGVLEVYNVNTCSQLPTSGYAYFFDNEVYHGYPAYDYVSPSFVGDVFQSGCGDWTYVNNSGDYGYLLY